MEVIQVYGRILQFRENYCVVTMGKGTGEQPNTILLKEPFTLLKMSKSDIFFSLSVLKSTIIIAYD